MLYNDFYVKGSAELELMGTFCRNCYIFRTTRGFIAINKKSYVKTATKIVYVGYTPSSFFDSINMDVSVMASSFEVTTE